MGNEKILYPSDVCCKPFTKFNKEALLEVRLDSTQAESENLTIPIQEAVEKRCRKEDLGKQLTEMNGIPVGLISYDSTVLFANCCSRINCVGDMLALSSKTVNKLDMPIPCRIGYVSPVALSYRYDCLHRLTV
jgi:hypothetical protein